MKFCLIQSEVKVWLDGFAFKWRQGFNCEENSEDM